MKNISELKNKGLKSSAWNFLNLLTNQLRNFIVTLILARLLTPADFGLVSMAMVLNAILDFFVDFGFSSAIIRKEKIYRSRNLHCVLAQYWYWRYLHIANVFMRPCFCLVL